MRISLSEVTPARISTALARRYSDLGNAWAWNFSPLGKENREINRSFKNTHKGETCIVICNGPSLNKTDMSLVKGVQSICMNRSYLMFDRWGFVPSYFAASAEQVLTQFTDDIRMLPMPKFIDFQYRSAYPMSEGFHYLRLPPRLVEIFAGDITGPMTTGGTVTYVSLQIAYFLGFKKVIIIGMDHRFSQKGIPTTTEVRTAEIDKDHVHPNYFPKGMKWEIPDLRRSELAYDLARKAFEADGRRIIDASVDGACTVFEKMDLASALGRG